mmetsp:Transcript_37597/g.118281  ORF Transcript_37597/g.118281 Transcript_37597/m.118281 type:complete len:208 (+) Transcript_37597:425-1048(+)
MLSRLASSAACNSSSSPLSTPSVCSLASSAFHSDAVKPRPPTLSSPVSCSRWDRHACWRLASRGDRREQEPPDAASKPCMTIEPVSDGARVVTSLPRSASAIAAAPFSPISFRLMSRVVSTALAERYSTSTLAISALMPWPERSHDSILFSLLSRSAAKIAHQPSVPSELPRSLMLFSTALTARAPPIAVAPSLAITFMLMSRAAST